MNVSEFVWHRLNEWGIKRVYGYPGDGVGGLDVALERARDTMQYVQVRHEEMAAFMASAHAKFTGEVGLCYATSGPGAIHLLNGLYDAKMDHVPVVAVVGQQARSAIGAHYQQAADCRKLGIGTHGCFILGLPGETRETIQETMRYAREIDPDTIQVSLPAPYPGTELYEQAIANGWMARDQLVDDSGVQSYALSYPHLSGKEIFDAVERFYKDFYFRPRVLGRIIKTMIRDSDVRRRRLREGREFLTFLSRRKHEAA